MMNLTPLLTDIAWPLTILIAWFAGEYAYKWLKLPRISSYALVGFVLAPTQAALLPQIQPAMLLLGEYCFWPLAV